MDRSCVGGLLACWGVLGLGMNAVGIVTSESPMVVRGGCVLPPVIVWFFMPWKSPVSGGRSFIFDLSPPGSGVVPSVVGQMI
eukprot:2892320-Alexandrium_andersonii.AAC.1